MPIDVHIPLRISVDPHAVASRLDDVSDAIASAVGRALARSQLAVIEPRGGYLAVHADMPEFRWCGETIATAARATFEQGVARAIADSITRAGLCERDDAPEPVPSGPSEAVDRERLWELMHGYELPSYGGAPNAETVSVRVPNARDRGSHRPHFAWRPLPAWRGEQSLNTVLNALAQAVGDRGGGFPHDYLGAIYRTEGTTTFDVVIFDFASPKMPPPYFRFGGVRLKAPVWQDRPDGGFFKDEVVVPPPNGTFRIETARYADPHSADAQSFFETFVATTMIPDLRRSAPRVFASKVDVAVRQIRQAFATWVADQDHGLRDFAVLATPAGKYLLVGLRRELPAVPIDLIPISSVVRPAAKATARGPQIQTIAGQSEKGSAFPTVPRYAQAPLQDAPFEGEPPFDELADADEVRTQIAQLCNHLQIDAARFHHAGAFCITAAYAIEGRAGQVSEYANSEKAGRIRAVRERSGNFGYLHFDPISSDSITFMRHLAAAVPMVSRLADAVVKLYGKPENTAKLRAPHAGDLKGWNAEFRLVLEAALESATGWIFALACQPVMLQLLAASRFGIEQRLDRFDEYAKVFGLVVEHHLVPEAHLAGLRRDLLLAGSGNRASYAATYNAQGGPGNIQYLGRERVILDNRGLQIYTLQDLDTQIRFRHSTALSIDPVILHVLHEVDLFTLAKSSPDDREKHYRGVLEKMRDANRKTREDARNDRLYAFTWGKIQHTVHDDASLRVPTIEHGSFKLQGIHALVHEQIGDAFGGSPFYARAVDALLARRAGYLEVKEFLEFVGLALLAVVCPPAAELVGVYQAIGAVRDARAKEAVYLSLLDPEQILNWGEAQAELFSSQLMAVVTVLPFLAGAVGTAAGALRTAWREGAGEVGASMRARIGAAIDHVDDLIVGGIVEAWVKEVASNVLIGQVIEHALDPVLSRIAEEANLPPWEAEP